MERIPFETGGFYHIYNRGTEKRNTYMNDYDYLRFLIYLTILNDDKNERTRTIRDLSASWQGSTLPKERRALLVDVVAFALMPNHFHLLLQQKQEGGISKLMQRLNTAYTMYFNEKYARSGVLFQGRYKCKEVDSEDYLLHLINYIHLNPLDIVESGWEERGIRNMHKTKDFLEKYRWSSYQDAIGVSNFPHTITLPLLRKQTGSPATYKNFIEKWCLDDLEGISDLIFYDGYGRHGKVEPCQGAGG